MIQIVRASIPRAELETMAEESFAEMVKAVVDIGRGVMAIGGDLHADEEQVLLQDGSRQEDLWGINLHPSAPEGLVEFDSMINVRPRQGNRSRGVEDAETQKRIIQIVERLVRD
jgi:hypothetical protein